MLKKENLIQGTPEWLQFRLEHNGASEAAAMLGISKLSTRNELLKIKSTGITKEFSDFVQRFVLDKGHEVEAMARPLVEDIIDDQLYPVTYSNGRLSASCDGLTGMGDIAFEHKQWNEAYAEQVRNGELPEEHWPQCQQVLLITGAEKLIFVISDGTPENLVWMWVYPDEALQLRIIAGWNQFDRDLADYVHVEVIEPPKAEAIKDLPAVTIQVKGELTTCNLDAVKPHFDKFLADAIITMETDDDFARAEAEAKLSRETAKRCKLTAKAVVDQMESISDVTRTLEEYAAKFDALALRQEKAVKAQKEARKITAKSERDQAYAAHIAALNDELNPIVLVLSAADKPDFVLAMKNQRTLKSLYNNLDTELARVKIAADSAAKEIREKLTWYKESATEFGFLFSDLQSIITNNSLEAFQAIVNNRIADHKKAEEEKLEQQREKIRQEEAARLQREAEEKLQAEKDRLAIEAKPVEEQAKPEAPVQATDNIKPVESLSEKQAVADHIIDQLIGGTSAKSENQPRQQAKPSREQLIAAICSHFESSQEEAESWLIDEFSQVAKAA
jgi:predicted phage-related endonuclease